MGQATQTRLGAKSLDERKLEIPTTTNNTLKLHNSMSLRLQRIPRDKEAKRQHACGASPGLLRQTPTRTDAASSPPALNTSMPPTRAYTASRPPALHTSTLARLHAYSAPPELPISIPPRPYA